MTGRAPWVALALVALSACGSTSSRHVLYGPRARPFTGRVIFSRAAALPGRSVREVALVHAVARGNQADTSHLMQALEAEAAALGCDHVLRLRTEQGSGVAVGIGVAVRSAPAAGGLALVGSEVPDLLTANTPWPVARDAGAPPSGDAEASGADAGAPALPAPSVGPVAPWAR